MDELTGLDTEPHWGVKEAARFLGFSHHTVYRWAEEGKLPSYKQGGRLRFAPKDLVAWRAAQVAKGRR